MNEDRCLHPASTPSKPGALCVRRKGHAEPGLDCTSDQRLAAMRDDTRPDPHGSCSCCLSLDYIVSILRYMLDTYPRDTEHWDWAASLMDEVGK